MGGFSGVLCRPIRSNASLIWGRSDTLLRRRRGTSGGWQAWHTLFPEAQLWAPRTTPFTLKKGHLPFTGILGDEPPQAWADDFDQLAFKGNPLIEEVIFLS